MTATASFDFGQASVLVTGGTSGIGHGIARAFLDAGASVRVTGSRTRPADYDVDLVGMEYRRCEMTSTEDIDGALDGLERLDVLVNCAGANLPGGRSEHKPDVFHEVVMINLIGLQRLTANARRLLATSDLEGGASVVNIASMASFFGVGMVPGYSAAKSGLVGLTRSLAVAWAPRGIRVNAVAPGLINTPMTSAMMEFESLSAPTLGRTPLGRFGTPDDVAPIVLFLASESARYVTGQTWCVDGGFSIAG